MIGRISSSTLPNKKHQVPAIVVEVEKKSTLPTMNQSAIRMSLIVLAIS